MMAAPRLDNRIIDQVLAQLYRIYGEYESDGQRIAETANVFLQLLQWQNLNYVPERSRNVAIWEPPTVPANCHFFFTGLYSNPNLVHETLRVRFSYFRTATRFAATLMPDGQTFNFEARHERYVSHERELQEVPTLLHEMWNQLHQAIATPPQQVPPPQVPPLLR